MYGTSIYLLYHDVHWLGWRSRNSLFYGENTNVLYCLYNHMQHYHDLDLAYLRDKL